ncbi:MAG: reverse gyrase [Minisyncoccia bacterium]
MNKIKSKYLEICPITKKEAKIEDILEYGESFEAYEKFKEKFWDLVNGKKCEDLNHAKNLCELNKKIRDFKKFFYSKFRTKPFNLQIYWAKRFFKKESFSIIAPTGFGKTTFGISISNFVNGKIYYIVPTKILLNEFYKRFNALNIKKKILIIKDTKDKKFLNENFDILITTSQFLHKNFDLLPKNFDFVFIDDADSMIRQPRNIDKVLKLVGFNDEDINNALKIIDSKRKGDFIAVNGFKDKINFKNKGQVIAASATLAPRTKRINLFRELLNFEIGISSTFLRNIYDLYENINEDSVFEKAVYWIKRLGKGGFIFLSSDFKKEDLEKFINYFKDNGINCISYEKFNKNNIKLFEEGEIDVIIGFSNIRNPLTRGIDLPHVVRYSIFIGVPKFKILLKPSYAPTNLLMLLTSFQEFFEDKFEVRRDILYLRKYSFLKEEDVLKNERIKERIEKIKEKLSLLIEDKNFLEKIKSHPLLVVKKENNDYYLLISDPRGYIQASGRTSRLFPLGLTKGLSLLLSEDNKILKNLIYKLRLLGYKIDFKEIEEEKIDRFLKEIDKDREIVKSFIKGEEFEFKDPVKSCLIIVESPTKAKTIANFFGKPARRKFKNFYVYEVSIGDYIINIIATLGHFVDLVHKRGYFGVEKENGEFLPIFQPIKTCLNCFRNLDLDENKCEVCGGENFLEKKDLIEVLRELASEVQEVYLATDPDSEGEKIAFDLFAYLYPYNKNIKRIEFHEITREEFLKRFKKPRKIKKSLVCAQLLRRISDRWIGFYLSEDIQKSFKNLNLSAGRVQTPVLGWVIKNEEERKKKSYFLRFILDDEKYINITTDDKLIVKEIKKNKEGLSISIRYKKIVEEEKKPLPPFQTSDLLKEAWNILRLNAQTTMDIAQNLFERGFITYHRTDSYYVSNFGKELAKEYLLKINKEKIYSPKNWGKQGTHECIRPTRPLSVGELIEENILRGEEILTKRDLSLYGLIFNRFMASQSRPAKIKKSVVEIKVKLNKKILFRKKEDYIIDILEPGYLEFYSNVFPFKLDEGDYRVKDILIKRFSKIPPYTTSILIDEMKNKGLGRPSTYSNIIQTLLNRKYLITNKGYLIPTKLSKKIYNYLIKKYRELIDENFTKELEKEMDLVEKNKVDYQKILLDLFLKLFKI